MRKINRAKAWGAWIVLAGVAASAGGCRSGIRRAGNALLNQGTSQIDYQKEADKTAFHYFTSENSQARLEGLEIEFGEDGRPRAVKVQSAEVLRMPSESHELFAGQLAAGGKADERAIAQYSDIAGSVAGAAVAAALQRYAAGGFGGGGGGGGSGSGGGSSDGGGSGDEAAP